MLYSTLLGLLLLADCFHGAGRRKAWNSSTFLPTSFHFYSRSLFTKNQERDHLNHQVYSLKREQVENFILSRSCQEAVVGREAIALGNYRPNRAPCLSTANYTLATLDFLEKKERCFIRFLNNATGSILQGGLDIPGRRFIFYGTQSFANGNSFFMSQPLSTDSKKCCGRSYKFYSFEKNYSLEQLVYEPRDLLTPRLWGVIKKGNNSFLLAQWNWEEKTKRYNLKSWQLPAAYAKRELQVAFDGLAFVAKNCQLTIGSDGQPIKHLCWSGARAGELDRFFSTPFGAWLTYHKNESHYLLWGINDQGARDAFLFEGLGSIIAIQETGLLGSKTLLKWVFKEGEIYTYGEENPSSIGPCWGKKIKKVVDLEGNWTEKEMPSVFHPTKPLFFVEEGIQASGIFGKTTLFKKKYRENCPNPSLEKEQQARARIIFGWTAVSFLALVGIVALSYLFSKSFWYFQCKTSIKKCRFCS